MLPGFLTGLQHSGPSRWSHLKGEAQVHHLETKVLGREQSSGARNHTCRDWLSARTTHLWNDGGLSHVVSPVPSVPPFWRPPLDVHIHVILPVVRPICHCTQASKDYCCIPHRVYSHIKRGFAGVLRSLHQQGDHHCNLSFHCTVQKSFPFFVTVCVRQEHRTLYLLFIQSNAAQTEWLEI